MGGDIDGGREEIWLDRTTSREASASKKILEYYGDSN